MKEKEITFDEARLELVMEQIRQASVTCIRIVT